MIIYLQFKEAIYLSALIKCFFMRNLRHGMNGGSFRRDGSHVGGDFSIWEIFCASQLIKPWKQLPKGQSCCNTQGHRFVRFGNFLRMDRLLQDLHLFSNVIWIETLNLEQQVLLLIPTAVLRSKQAHYLELLVASNRNQLWIISSKWNLSGSRDHRNSETHSFRKNLNQGNVGDLGAETNESFVQRAPDCFWTLTQVFQRMMMVVCPIVLA